MLIATDVGFPQVRQAEKCMIWPQVSRATCLGKSKCYLAKSGNTFIYIYIHNDIEYNTLYIYMDRYVYVYTYAFAYRVKNKYMYRIFQKLAAFVPILRLAM